MMDSNRVWKLLCEQERMLLAEVDAIRVSGKPEVIGALFEEQFRGFLARLVPASISVVPGFVVDETGRDSSHFDALLIDNSYPFLGSVGPHRYVMAASVVAAIELTTKLDAQKLNMVIEKSEEISRISGELYKPNSFGSIGFYAICADSQLPCKKIESMFRDRKPYGMLFALRGREKMNGLVAWIDGGRDGPVMCIPSKSPLADFVSMQSQDTFYALSDRIRDVQTIGEKMNSYINWGTIRDNVEKG